MCILFFDSHSRRSSSGYFNRGSNLQQLTQFIFNTKKIKKSDLFYLLHMCDFICISKNNGTGELGISFKMKMMPPYQV